MVNTYLKLTWSVPDMTAEREVLILNDHLVDAVAQLENFFSQEAGNP